MRPSHVRVPSGKMWTQSPRPSTSSAFLMPSCSMPAPLSTGKTCTCRGCICEACLLASWHTALVRHATLVLLWLLGSGVPNQNHPNQIPNTCPSLHWQHLAVHSSQVRGLAFDSSSHIPFDRFGQLINATCTIRACKCVHAAAQLAGSIYGPCWIGVRRSLVPTGQLPLRRCSVMIKCKKPVP